MSQIPGYHGVEESTNVGSIEITHGSTAVKWQISNRLIEVTVKH